MKFINHVSKMEFRPVLKAGSTTTHHILRCLQPGQWAPVHQDEPLPSGYQAVALVRNPGDHTPRLLIERLRPSEGGSSGVGGGGGVGGVVGRGGGASDESVFVTGRLLLSPWSAFKGVFPMHGTYFFQNEVFEDEGAGEVSVPRAALGTAREVYLGKSIEGVLRRREVRELQHIFRHGFVCIRRFRTSDCRLLPLVLDSPLLLKNKAA